MRGALAVSVPCPASRHQMNVSQSPAGRASLSRKAGVISRSLVDRWWHTRVVVCAASCTVRLLCGGRGCRIDSRTGRGGRSRRESRAWRTTRPRAALANVSHSQKDTRASAPWVRGAYLSLSNARRRTSRAVFFLRDTEALVGFFFSENFDTARAPRKRKERVFPA